MKNLPALLLLSIAALSATAAVAAEPAAAPAAPAAALDPQEMVCKKSPETGSLVKARKTCHTRAQWQYIYEENQRFSRNLQDDTRGRVAGQ